MGNKMGQARPSFPPEQTMMKNKKKGREHSGREVRMYTCERDVYVRVRERERERERESVCV